MTKPKPKHTHKKRGPKPKRTSTRRGTVRLNIYLPAEHAQDFVERAALSGRTYGEMLVALLAKPL